MSEQRLTFVKFHHIKIYKAKKNGKVYNYNHKYNLYRCRCGNHIVTAERYVKRNRTKSCGCLVKEMNKDKLPPKQPKNWGNWMGAGAKKGNKSPTKGLVFIPDNPGHRARYNKGRTGHYEKPERADAQYYGLEGEVHSLRIRQAPNKGKKLINGRYV